MSMEIDSGAGPSSFSRKRDDTIVDPDTKQEIQDRKRPKVALDNSKKVEHSDTLPQEICSNCIRFINKSIQFRKNCEEAQIILQNYTLGDKVPHPFTNNTDESSKINIAHTNNEDFDDFDDNIPLDTLKVEGTCVEKPLECLEICMDTKTAHTPDLVFNKKRCVVRKENAIRSLKDNRETKSTEEIECEYCHKVLTSKLSLRNHYKIHTGFDVVCEHCGKKFITRRLLLMHCRAKHGYEKTDKCSFCEYKASNAEQVKIHERLHTGEKPYVCKECNAGFHRKSSYLQHIAIHLPEKTVQCDQCPARFKSVTLMRIHKNRHRAPQYRYKCGVCDNSFARRRNAARHLQRVHGVSPDHHIHRHNIH
ncbi:unnamed protein product [Leptosia nina]|uniref:C2H2-type domain-containing protein n=1 Tax=Leptosia nina TaxID=320188 RepID=A0AAV1K5T6_9NEOP